MGNIRGLRLVVWVVPVLAAMLISQLYFVAPASAAGTTYYVDGGNVGGVCNDTNSGLATNLAWCTIQKAATTAIAGDTVYIRGGTYRETVTPAASGASGSPIIYKRYQSEVPIIDGSDAVTGWTQTGIEEAGGLFANGLEGGDFSSYASTQGDAGNVVSVQTGTARNGTNAMQSSYAGSDPDARANRSFTASDDVYARMYFRINSAYSLNSNDTNHTIMALRTSTVTTRASVHLLKNASGQFYLNARLDSPSVTNLYTGPAGEVVPDTWYSVELRYKGNDAATGGGQFWLDGSLKGGVNNINTTGIQTSRLEVGGNSTGGGGATWPTNGSAMFFDDIKVDNAAVGAFSASGDPHVYKAGGVTWTARQLFEDGISLGAGQSNLAAVNGPGEWYLDTGASQLYVWTTDGASPASALMEASRRTTVVDLSDRSYITLDGLTLQRNNSNGSAGAAVLASSSGNLVVANSVIKDNYGAGVLMKDTTDSSIQSNTLLRNQRLFGGGIRLENGSQSNLIDGNTITGNGGAAGNGIFFCGDSSCNSVGNVNNTISNNTISNVQDSCLYLDTNNDNNIIQHNTCHNSVRDVDDTSKGGNGFHLSLGSDSNTVRYNVVYDMERHGISIRDGNASQGYISNNNSAVYNNTVYNTGTAGTGNGIDVQGSNAGTTIRNNIVYGGSTASINVDAGSTTATTSDYNLVYNPSGKVGKWAGTTHSTLTAYQAASGQESRSISTDPTFRSAGGADFRLLQTSPAINGGVNLNVTADRAGVGLPQGSLPDIGAYEFLTANVPSGLFQYKPDAVTVLSAGAAIGDTSMIVKFMVGSGNPTDTLTPQIEVRPVGVAFSNVPTSSADSVSYNGAAVLGSALVGGLTGGVGYHWQMRIANAAGNGSWVSYGGNDEATADFTVVASASVSSGLFKPLNSPDVSAADYVTDPDDSAVYRDVKLPDSAGSDVELPVTERSKMEKPAMKDDAAGNRLVLLAGGLALAAFAGGSAIMLIGRKR